MCVGDNFLYFDYYLIFILEIKVEFFIFTRIIIDDRGPPRDDVSIV